MSENTPKSMVHHKDGRFFNPTLNSESDHKSFLKGLRMWRETPKAKWPRHVENTHTPQIQAHVAANTVAVTFVNHVTFLLQLPGLNILTDPVWCKRVSPLNWLGPKRVRKPGINIKDLPPIDLILLSHNHYDHLDIKTLHKLNKLFSPKICMAMGDSRVVRHIKFADMYELDWWDDLVIDKNTKINFTPMQHWSARGLHDQYRSLWGSYVIEHGGSKIFFGGDGGYCNHFKDIHSKFGAMDLAFIGIGAYEPRWFMKNMHTNPEEAVLIHKDLHAKKSIGMHFGTFQLSAEGFEQPLLDLQTAKLQHEIADETFITLEVGETRIFSLA